MVMIGLVMDGKLGTLCDGRNMGCDAGHFHPSVEACVQHCVRVRESEVIELRAGAPAQCEEARVQTTPRNPLLSLAVAALATLAIAAPLNAQNGNAKLPDIGSSAGKVLGPAQQSQYGAMTLAQLRHYGYVLDDP